MWNNIRSLQLSASTYWEFFSKLKAFKFRIFFSFNCYSTCIMQLSQQDRDTPTVLVMLIQNYVYF